ncbi:MAG: tRNA preQ1(34) S-adenosylmethionine ribosyltransferase-isomerase QueA [Gammaproteobacteria bacterium]
MQLSDFNFELPPGLIARYPLSERSASRLLCLNRKTGEIFHNQFNDLPSVINKQDLLVFNDTRVLQARLFGQKASGGNVEVLVERILNEHETLVQIKASKTPKPGTTIIFTPNISATVLAHEAEWFRLRFETADSVSQILEEIGHLPLPPYLQRPAELIDDDRYQTVFADREGAVAAPTAGLHFDLPILRRIVEKGVQNTFITLHVGAGTFQPIRTKNIVEHRLHGEYCEVPKTVCNQIEACHKKSGRVMAVGTTTVRSLESAAQTGVLKPYQGDTHIFIYPGYQFRCVDVLLTNFHLPKSTLLMLVCAFGGYEAVMAAYRQAVEKKYRFFSYGDAMLIF